MFFRALSLLLSISLLGPSFAAGQSAANSTTQPSTANQSSVPLPNQPGTRPSVAAPASGPIRSIAGPDYRLGNGDVLEVQVAGRLEVTRMQVIVDPEGTVNIPPLGAIQVGGLTLLEANRQISERARTMLRFSDVSVAVAAPRAFEVIISGEVERPGTVSAMATQRLHEVLLNAGGITQRGSVRRVQVMRANDTRVVDLLRFELRGDPSQNPYVEDRMRVHVPPRGPSVILSGAVRRPGEYELAPGNAGSDARLTRVGADGRKETTSIDLRTVLDAPNDVQLAGSDTLFVPSLAILQDIVEVRGAFIGVADSSKTQTSGKTTIVQRFELAHGERVRDVTIRAGGAAAYADLQQAFVDRTSPTGPRQRVPLDLHRLLVEKDETQNILLQNGDVMTLPVVEDKVYVVGEVKAPGAQDYRPDLTPREYVALAGGPNNRAKMSETIVTFRNGRTYAMAEAPPLEAGAVVTVPEVAVKWWQDYLLIAQVIASLVTAYTGLYVIFGGGNFNNN